MGMGLIVCIITWGTPASTSRSTSVCVCVCVCVYSTLFWQP